MPVLFVTQSHVPALIGLVALVVLSTMRSAPAGADSAMLTPVPSEAGAEAPALLRNEPLIDPRAERAHRVDASPSDIFLVPYGIERGVCDRRRLASDAFGGVVGLAAGGVGSETVAAASPSKAPYAVAGAAAGPLVGPRIGRMMDEVDHHCIGRTLEYAPDRHSVRWKNDLKALAYAIVPVRTFQNPNGLYCREYLASATVGGKALEALASACRGSNGAWKLLRSE